MNFVKYFLQLFVFHDIDTLSSLRRTLIWDGDVTRSHDDVTSEPTSPGEKICRQHDVPDQSPVFREQRKLQPLTSDGVSVGPEL